ncbi:MAG: aryl-sulfate sulfotransferase [Thermodesulfovibrionales bacterium]|nr:aryl-sulfate sulfotransferase [Thermodesulfovibrionales bacterium]
MKIEKILFSLGILMIIYYIGMITAYKESPVYTTLVVNAAKVIVDFQENWRINTGLHPQGKHLQRYHKFEPNVGEGLITFKPEKSFAGHTLIAGFYVDDVGARIFDHEGNQWHGWDFKMRDFIGDKVDKLPFGKYQTFIHGIHLYENGDLLINLGGTALIKTDFCGNVLWSLKRRVHHALHVDEHGTIWTMSSKVQKKEIALIKPPIKDRTILKVSPEGKLLEEISLLDTIVNSGYEGLLSADKKNAVGSEPIENPFHTNDIEVLSSDMAKAFPLFKAGDYMVSIRNLNTIIVVDGETNKIKWTSTGVTIRQHDADFQPDGTITIYDNRSSAKNITKTKKDLIFGWSRIAKIHPMSQKVEASFQGTKENGFYSKARGKHQFLPNGNILVTQASYGRIFETTPEGEIVWEFMNQWDNDFASLSSEGFRFTDSYIASAPSCKEATAKAE